MLISEMKSVFGGFLFFFFFFAQLDILDYVLEAVLQWMSSDLDNMCASPDSAGMWTTSI